MFKLFRQGRLSACLLSILLMLQGCGGGGSSSGPEPKKTPTNINITFSGESSVVESDTIEVTANAPGATGYSWSISDSSITLNNGDTASVSFVAPPVDTDTEVTLILNATGPDGASGSNTFKVDIKRIFESLTVQGLVTDEPIPFAKVTFQVGSDTQEVTADENGFYAIDLVVDEQNVNALVKVTATGDATNPEVEFVSLLPAINTLQQDVGDDGVLDSDDSFGVNVTNVSTAEFVLIEKANNGEAPSSESDLEALTLLIDPEEKLEIAAAIKLIVDNDDFDLPDGVESTLALVQDTQATNDFIEEVMLSQPDALQSVIEAIIEDETLISEVQPLTSGSYIIGNETHFTLNEDGSGELIYVSSEATEITWSQEGGAVTLTVVAEDYLIASYSDYVGENYTKQEIYLDAIDIELVAQNEHSYDVVYSLSERTLHPESSIVVTTDEPDKHISSLVNTNSTEVFSAEKLMATNWYVSYFTRINDRDSLSYIDFKEDGLATVVYKETEYAAQWSITNNSLNLSVPEFTYTDELGHDATGVDNQYWLISSNEATMELAAINNGVSNPYSTWAQDQNPTGFTSDEVSRGWLFYNGDRVTRYELYDDGSFIGDWNAEGTPYRWSIQDDGQLLRERDRCKVDNNNGNQVCFTDQKVLHKRIAANGDFFYVARHYQAFDFNFNTDELDVIYDAWAITKYSFTEHYGHDRFSNWAENRYFYALSAEDPDASISRVELTQPNDGSWKYYDLVPKGDDTSYIVFESYDDGDIEYYPYNFVAGHIAFNDGNDMRISIVDHQRDFYTVCVYQAGANAEQVENCATGELVYFFDELDVAEKMKGESIINQAKFVGSTVYDIDLSDNTSIEAVAMAMADDGTVVLTDATGTEYSGIYEFVEGNVISFNIPADGEDWTTFAVITDYDADRNIYFYCWVDDKDNITAEQAKAACLEDEVFGTDIDELYYGAFLFDVDIKDAFIGMSGYAGDYALADMHFSLNSDGSGNFQTNSDYIVEINWSVDDETLTISAESDATISSYLEWSNEFQQEVEYHQELSLLTIEITDRTENHSLANYQINTVTKDIYGLGYEQEDIGSVLEGATLFNKHFALDINSLDILGEWYIEDFIPYLGDAKILISSSGQGTAQIGRESYELTWSVEDDNSITFEVQDYSFHNSMLNYAQFGYSASYWLFDDSNDFYIKGSMLSGQNSGAINLLKAQNVSAFTEQEAANSWYLNWGLNTSEDEFDSKYNFYADGEITYNFSYSFINEWRMEDGDIFRYRIWCDYQVGCFESNQINHKKIATHGDLIFILREVYSGSVDSASGQVNNQLSTSSIATIKLSEFFGETEFTDRVDNSAFSVIGSNSTIETWTFAATDYWRRDNWELLSDDINYLVQEVGDNVEYAEYQIDDGNVLYTIGGIDYTISVMGTDRYYNTVCVAQSALMDEACSNGDILYFYRHYDKANQHQVLEAPAPVARFRAEDIVSKGFSVTNIESEFVVLTFDDNNSGTIEYQNGQTSQVTWYVNRGVLYLTDDNTGIRWQLVATGSDETGITFTLEDTSVEATMTELQVF